MIILGECNFLQGKSMMGMENDKTVFPSPPGVDREFFKKNNILVYSTRGIWRKEISPAVKDASSSY